MSMHAATSQSKKHCSTCEKGAGSFSCDGCGQSFCLKHVAEHRQELTRQMDLIEQEHDILHEELLNQAKKQGEHQIVQRIDRWEKESIEKIQQTADESRNTLKQILESVVDYGQKSLNKVLLKLRRARESDDFFENDLDRWMQYINRLRAEVESMANRIDIVHDRSTSAIPLIEIVHDHTVPGKDTNWISPLSWLADVKTLFYDPLQKSSSTKDNKTTDSFTQTDATNSIVIIRVDPTDHYIDIENGSSDENMTGWTLRRDGNNQSKIIYKFPADYILHRQSHLRISCDIIDNEGSQDMIHLINNHGEEKSSIIPNA